MLNPDYRDMLCMLNEEGVEYLVVGAHALAAYGYPRATGDIDLWIRCSEENAERVWRALRRFGAPLHDLTVADLATPEIVFQIGVVPRRIDVLTSIAAVSFDDAWPRRKDTWRACHESGKRNESPLEIGDLIMGKTASNLVEEIKKLSCQDRAAIVVEVLDTLDEEGEEFDDEELLRELQQREGEGMNGSVPWSVLRDML